MSHVDPPAGVRIKLVGHLKVHRGERVVIHKLRAASSVSAALALGAFTSPARSRTVRATRLDVRGHQWGLVIPPSSGRVDRVRIAATYPHGDASYEAGVHLVASAGA